MWGEGLQDCRWLSANLYHSHNIKLFYALINKCPRIFIFFFFSFLVTSLTQSLGEVFLIYFCLHVGICKSKCIQDGGKEKLMAAKHQFKEKNYKEERKWRERENKEKKENRDEIKKKRGEAVKEKWVSRKKRKKNERKIKPWE